MPPGDTSFLITRLWDKYLLLWRAHKDMPSLDTSEHQAKIIEEINKFADDENPDAIPHDEHDMSKLDLVRRGLGRLLGPSQSASCKVKRFESTRGSKDGTSRAAASVQ